MVQGARSHLPLSKQIDLVLPDLIDPQQVRRLVDVFGKPRYMEQIALDHLRAKVPHLRVLNHPLPQSGHDTSLLFWGYGWFWLEATTPQPMKEAFSQRGAC
jgi:hypothetical protein